MKQQSRAGDLLLITCGLRVGALGWVEQAGAPKAVAALDGGQLGSHELQLVEVLAAMRVILSDPLQNVT